jgi:signal transduction histidine kinase
LAGSLAIFIFVVQIVYELVVNEPSLGSTRATQLASALAFVTVPLAFLVGLLRAQFARAGVAEIVVALQRAPGRQQLADVLAKALGDRSLVLGYWLPRFESYVDAEGQPVILPPDRSGRAATFVDHEGRRAAALVHDAALSYEPELLQIVCAAADVALEQERLQAELKARAEELIGSRARIVEAGDAERRRLERNLHDGAQQRLIALSLELSLLKSAVAGDGDVSRRLDQARDEIAASLGELREVARGIHPAVVAAHGLEVALEQLAARAVVPVRLNVEIGSRLPERLEVAAFYVVSESLANVAKHADATSAIINVSRANGHVTVEVTDDGVGGADTERGSGLRGLADRVEALEGRLRIWSPAGGGTRLRAEIPCAS